MVELAAARSFDPDLGLQRVTIDGDPTPIGDADAAANAIATGRRALASQMVGACEQMLADTLEYVNARHQYGRAIGSFQTVKHRLAEVKVATTAARNGTAAAWEHADGPDGATLAIASKCLAGRAQQLASTHCFQVHGGIAFTVEHGFQLWVRRGLLLDHLLGGHEQLTAELGRRLITAGAVPRVPQLY
jgi:alkylation response protein AidB-like acyl-CoA dehydrogenase